MKFNKDNYSYNYIYLNICSDFFFLVRVYE